MERVNQIMRHPLYRECLKKTEEWERDRIFCHHDMGHFHDVARIAMILNLQEGLQIEQEIIYAAALTHDIGRYQQYEDGTPHEQASAKIAPVILKDCDFQVEEIQTITHAITNHRNASIQTEPTLAGILYRADKLSRACYCCKAEAQCDWKKGKKNADWKL